jgi:pyruvate dehydrogenase E2 component (dihydrolipoamide acetyltransferase)
MSIELKMPALSPTMEEGTLAKWLVKEGDTVKSGDIIAEIETDKATMEFESIDEGVVTSLLVAEGSEGVKVGTVIATIAGEGDDAKAPAPAPKVEAPKAEPVVSSSPAAPLVAAPVPAKTGDRIIASPLAKKLAEQLGVDLSALIGTGPNGRIVKEDVQAASGSKARAPSLRRLRPQPPRRSLPMVQFRTRSSNSPACAKPLRGA